ncbi:response regulator transcription factor [Aquisalimonas sp.]|uniref:LuxR C-terminal-related transcriptional regulator n=1 Tax=unclassified Aquisalimonas TaxID=2644645 RepID=UPI0025C4FD90|nr:response regulator transcription factor [Aquisalimonas sp.]
MNGTQSIRVLVADDHRLVRHALTQLIESLQGLVVVAEAGSGHELVQAAITEHPDVALVDAAIYAHGDSSQSAMLQRTSSDVATVVLSNYVSNAFIRRTLQSGACCFLYKDAGIAELKQAIHHAAEGRLFTYPPLDDGPSLKARRPVEDSVLPSPEPSLTQRQREVLRLVASGYRTKGIAERLGVSVKTVETHRAEIMRRLGVSNMVGLVHEAIRLGMVSAPP